MLDADREYYVRAATHAMLSGAPFESLADWAAQEKAKAEAAKVISFADARARLRPQR
jgi:5'-deoxynucleotidase YfbR-like HD superfamily hydrolase